MPAPYPNKFRRRAVELARRSNHSIASLAKGLQISESCLRSWVDQADIDENGSDFRLTSEEKRELAELRMEKRRLEIENDILKRAVAHFASENICPR
ncbi:MAG: transposase [Pseudonocardiaceae bacterium]